MELITVLKIIECVALLGVIVLFFPLMYFRNTTTRRFLLEWAASSLWYIVCIMIALYLIKHW